MMYTELIRSGQKHRIAFVESKIPQATIDVEGIEPMLNGEEDVFNH